MKRVIKKLAEELHKEMCEPDAWGTLTLPRGFDMTFEIPNVCKLELREDCSVVESIQFSILRKGDWITVEMFEAELTKLFKKITFSEYEIEEYLKLNL